MVPLIHFKQSRSVLFFGFLLQKESGLTYLDYSSFPWPGDKVVQDIWNALQKESGATLEAADTDTDCKLEKPLQNLKSQDEIQDGRRVKTFLPILVVLTLMRKISQSLVIFFSMDLPIRNLISYNKQNIV